MTLRYLRTLITTQRRRACTAWLACLWQAQAALADRVSALTSRGSHVAMSMLSSVSGPPKTYLRVFADLRVFVPAAALYLSMVVSTFGLYPALALVALLAATCRMLL